MESEEKYLDELLRSMTEGTPVSVPEEPESQDVTVPQDSAAMSEDDISALLDAAIDNVPQDIPEEIPAVLEEIPEEPLTMPGEMAEESLTVQEEMPEDMMVIPELDTELKSDEEISDLLNSMIEGLPEDMPIISDDMPVMSDTETTSEEISDLLGTGMTDISGESLAFDDIASLTEDEIEKMLQTAAEVSDEMPEIPDISDDAGAADILDMIQKSDEHELMDEDQIALSEELDQLDMQLYAPDASDMQSMGENDVSELLESIAAATHSEEDVQKAEKARRKEEAAEQKRQEKARKKQEKERKKQEKEQKREQKKQQSAEKATGGLGAVFARFKKQPKEDLSAGDDIGIAGQAADAQDTSFEESIKELLGNDTADTADESLTNSADEWDSLESAEDTMDEELTLEALAGEDEPIMPEADAPLPLEEPEETDDDMALDILSDDEAISLGEAFGLPEETMELLKGADDAAEDEPLALSEAEATLAIRDRNDESDEEEEAPKAKRKGFFSRLMGFLLEEDASEEEEEAELPTGKVSEENQAILDELDADEGKKAKGKKEKKKKEKKNKKGKGGSEGEEEEPKEKKKKKEKVKKEKKKKEPVAEEPQKKLPKKKVKAAVLFSATILAVLLIFGLLIPSLLSKKQARDAYAAGRYETAYQNYYGKKLSAKDQEMFEKTEMILKVQRKWKSYNNYIQMNKPLEALDALMQGVERYQGMEKKADEYGISGKVGKYYKKMLTVLRKDYNVSEYEAILITELEDDMEYTKALQNILNGLKYNAVSDTDYREELEPLADEIPEEELEEDLTEPEPEETGNLLFEIFAK